MPRTAGSTRDLEKCGQLSCVPLTETEFVQTLRVLGVEKKTDLYDFLYLFLSKDLVRFIDTFSGEKIRLISRSDLLKIIQHVKIYNFIRSRGMSDDTLKTASTVFGRRKHYLRKVYTQVASIMEG